MKFYSTHIFPKLISYINKGDLRSVNIKKNLIFSLLFKGLNIIISLLIVPITMDFVSPKQYGIWLTLSSIISWFSFFDIGLGNGLRNKFTEALVYKKNNLARIYVSTTYFILSILIGVILIIFLLINPFLNWAIILNTDISSFDELSKLALILFSFFSIQFVLQLITTIITANQQPAKASAISFFGNLLSLTLIYIFTKTTTGSLTKLCLALSGSNVLVLLIATLYFYKGEYKKYAPSLKFVRLKYSKLLTGIGIKFFLIQIAAIVLFQSNNLIISQLFGPEDVTPYNIVYKYFGIILMISGIIMTPLWSAFTDAWHRKDFDWIKNTIYKLQKFWLLITLFTILLLLISPLSYTFWIGDRILIPFNLSFYMAINTIIIAWNMIYVQFINGIGKVQLQLYSGIFGTCLTIPLTYFLAKHFNITGVVISSSCLGGINTIWTYIQYKKLINQKATGIWNK